MGACSLLSLVHLLLSSIMQPILSEKGQPGMMSLMGLKHG